MSTPEEDRRAAAARRLANAGQHNAALDRLADLAGLLLGTRSAQISVISDVQLIMGGLGAAAAGVGTPTASSDSLCDVTVHQRAPLVVEDAVNDVRVAHLPPVRSGAAGCYLGVPLTTATGDTIGALCVFDTAPRAWTDDEVTLLTRLATSVLAELELAALSADYESDRIAWELAVDAAGVGAFTWDLRTGRLDWDHRLLDLFGMDADTFDGTIEAFNSAVHPDDLDRVRQALSTAIDSCGEFGATYRVPQPNGQVRWVAARGRALPGPDGTAVRVMGAAYDTTAVQEGETRVARLLEAMPTAFFQLDTGWRFAYVNAEAERLLGATRDELIGEVIWDVFPASLHSDFEKNYRHAVDTGAPVTFDAYYPAPLDAWYEARAWPSPDGLSVYFVDVTIRRQTREQLEQASARNAFAAAVTANLTGTLDIDEAVSKLAPMIVPALGDWCVVSLVNDVESGASWQRTLRDVGWWHTDPAMRPVLERYAEVRSQALTDSSYVARALQSRKPVVIESGAAAAVSAVLEPGEARELLRQLDPGSAVVVQMRGRGRVAGMLSVFRAADRAPFSADDVATLGDVATRAGLALDTARSYAGQREVAETLQRSLLTEPPQPDHLQIAVRYEPAAEQAQVGGDWYDAFMQPDGSTMVVIGDVVGHDTAAAAAMGQVRGLLRGIAVHTGDGPADVLAGVDRAMESLLVHTTATAVVARLEQTQTERESRVTRLRWANAGHPPPLLLHADGSVSALAADRSNLLLGFDPATDRDEHVVTVERGSTVLLFTDGLIERRGQSIDEGLDRLAKVLESTAAADVELDELCDRVLRTMLADQPDDDVALVAVRLHREDGPRPPEAGPERVPESVP